MGAREGGRGAHPHGSMGVGDGNCPFMARQRPPNDSLQATVAFLKHKIKAEMKMKMKIDQRETLQMGPAEVLEKRAGQKLPSGGEQYTHPNVAVGFSWIPTTDNHQ